MFKNKKINKKIFKNKNFLLLWSGQLTSEIGDNLLDFALTWYIYQVTGSTLALSISILSIYIPKALVSTFSGVIADKFDRKKIIVISDTLNGLLVMFLFLIGSITSINLTIIVIFNILSSILSAIFNPAMSAAVQSTLTQDELKDAGSLLQIEGYICTILGAGLSGILLNYIGIKYLILIDGVTFLISAILESFIKIKKPSYYNSETNEEFKYFKKIFEFLKANKIILYTTLFAGIIANGVFISISIYLPGIFENTLKTSSTELGIFYSIIGISSFIVSTIFLYTNKNIDPYNWTIIGLFIEGIVFILISKMNNLYVAYITAIIYGTSCAICSISSSMLSRKLIPNNLMGGMGSFNVFISSITMPIFTILYGQLGQIFTLQKIISISSILFFILLIPAPIIFNKEKKKQNNKLNPPIVNTYSNE